jgi:LysR family glycine cleavage system transcriptional activator
MPFLPSLHALRAFEASARLGSFKAAARELFVTPAAVSQQIKLLEEELGTRLFIRMNRAVALTEAGQALAPVLRDAFERITETVRRLPGRERPGTLTISVLPSFAAKWLVPRLGRFQQRHPEIDVRISASMHLVDFGREDVDLAIRHGSGSWTGVTAVRLFAEDLVPVCSPRLLRGRHPLRTPQDLRRQGRRHRPRPGVQ